ncbi:MAG TPA: transporter associated domain-containing protein, partial [Gemmatimonadaceae bacterium]|nr:transporter associated domain-containing protein [Gemmatimonadaceae bacterium]
AEPEIVRHPDGSWIVDAGTALEDLEHALDLDPLPAAERIGFRSVGGLIMARLGSVPTEGESVVVDGLRFEVIRMEGRRIATVRVSGPNDGRQAAADR